MSFMPVQFWSRAGLLVAVAVGSGAPRAVAQQTVDPDNVPGCYAVAWHPRPTRWGKVPVADTLRLGAVDSDDSAPGDSIWGGPVGAGRGPIASAAKRLETGNWASWRTDRHALLVRSPGMNRAIGLMLHPDSAGYAGDWDVGTDLAPPEHGRVSLRRIPCRASEPPNQRMKLPGGTK